MSITVSILIFNFIGTLGAWQPDIDFNRVRLLFPSEEGNKHITTVNSHKRRSIFSNNYNDYDNRSGRLSKLHTSLQYIPEASTTDDKKTVNVYKPREDPRQFYQSDAYFKKVNRENINNEVSEIYPGSDVVKADRSYNRFKRPYSARLSARHVDDVDNYVHKEKVCVKCPNDRTVIVKAGSDRVILQYPNLKSCPGYKTPKEVKFITKYGPRFGSLLGEGFYGIVGYLTYRNEILQYCNMNVRVLTQTCPVPKYLKAQCEDGNNTCSFTCRDPKTILYGHQTLTCGGDMKWVGRLPYCKVPNWCESLSPPTRGRISCKGATVNGWGLVEGSICRVRCARGWKPTPRSLVVCRKGTWTYNVTCVPISYS